MKLCVVRITVGEDVPVVETQLHIQVAATSSSTFHILCPHFLWPQGLLLVAALKNMCIFFLSSSPPISLSSGHLSMFLCSALSTPPRVPCERKWLVSSVAFLESGAWILWLYFKLRAPGLNRWDKAHGREGDIRKASTHPRILCILTCMFKASTL